MGIFPLTVLRDSPSPWDPMESLGVAGKGVQHPRGSSSVAATFQVVYSDRFMSSSQGPS